MKMNKKLNNEIPKLIDLENNHFFQVFFSSSSEKSKSLCEKNKLCYSIQFL
jgi:hypothetical protein